MTHSERQKKVVNTIIETPPMIHPTAVVNPEAGIGRDVAVGAFSCIGPRVEIGDGCKIHNHVTIDGQTTLGAGCSVFPGAVLGLPPQDLKYRGGDVRLEIGERNTFREMVTVHPGTENGGGSRGSGMTTTCSSACMSPTTATWATVASLRTTCSSVGTWWSRITWFLEGKAACTTS